MYKKAIISAFIFFSLIHSSYAQTMNGGVSFDYRNFETKEIKKIQKSLPSLEKDFIDLNYSIEYKPLNLLGTDDFVKKFQPKNSIKFQENTAPSNYEISLSTGKATGNNNPSEQLYSLLKKNPNNKDLLFAYSIQLKNEKQLASALEIADRALKIDPEYALAHFLRGDILRNMGKYKEAVEEYIYTTQINPYCADAYYNIAKILEILNDKELALDYYKTAYQINPNDLEIRDIILNNYVKL